MAGGNQLKLSLKIIIDRLRFCPPIVLSGAEISDDDPFLQRLTVGRSLSVIRAKDKGYIDTYLELVQSNNGVVCVKKGEWNDEGLSVRATWLGEDVLDTLLNEPDLELAWNGKNLESLVLTGEIIFIISGETRRPSLEARVHRQNGFVTTLIEEATLVIIASPVGDVGGKELVKKVLEYRYNKPGLQFKKESTRIDPNEDGQDMEVDEEGPGSTSLMGLEFSTFFVQHNRETIKKAVEQRGGTVTNSIRAGVVVLLADEDTQIPPKSLGPADPNLIVFMSEEFLIGERDVLENPTQYFRGCPPLMKRFGKLRTLAGCKLYFEDASKKANKKKTQAIARGAVCVETTNEANYIVMGDLATTKHTSNAITLHCLSKILKEGTGHAECTFTHFPIPLQKQREFESIGDSDKPLQGTRFNFVTSQDVMEYGEKLLELLGAQVTFTVEEDQGESQFSLENLAVIWDGRDDPVISEGLEKGQLTVYSDKVIEDILKSDGQDIARIFKQHMIGEKHETNQEHELMESEDGPFTDGDPMQEGGVPDPVQWMGGVNQSDQELNLQVNRHIENLHVIHPIVTLDGDESGHSVDVVQPSYETGEDVGPGRLPSLESDFNTPPGQRALRYQQQGMAGIKKHFKTIPKQAEKVANPCISSEIDDVNPGPSEAQDTPIDGNPTISDLANIACILQSAFVQELKFLNLEVADVFTLVEHILDHGVQRERITVNKYTDPIAHNLERNGRIFPYLNHLYKDEESVFIGAIFPNLDTDLAKNWEEGLILALTQILSVFRLKLGITKSGNFSFGYASKNGKSEYLFSIERNGNKSRASNLVVFEMPIKALRVFWRPYNQQVALLKHPQAVVKCSSPTACRCLPKFHGLSGVSVKVIHQDDPDLEDNAILTIIVKENGCYEWESKLLNIKRSRFKLDIGIIQEKVKEAIYLTSARAEKLIVGCSVHAKEDNRVEGVLVASKLLCPCGKSGKYLCKERSKY